MRELQEVAFDRIVVEDPTLCDLCAVLLCIDQVRSGWRPREAGIDVALEVIGTERRDVLLDARIDRAVAARTASLWQELTDARETIAALKDELRRWSAEDGEIDRLLDRLGV